MNSFCVYGKETLTAIGFSVKATFCNPILCSGSLHPLLLYHPWFCLAIQFCIAKSTFHSSPFAQRRPVGRSVNRSELSSRVSFGKYLSNFCLQNEKILDSFQRLYIISLQSESSQATFFLPSSQIFDSFSLFFYCCQLFRLTYFQYLRFLRQNHNYLSKKTYLFRFFQMNICN